MYRGLRVIIASVEPNRSVNGVSPFRVETFEFPVLAKYRWLDIKIIRLGDRWNQPPAPAGCECLSLRYQGRGPWLYLDGL
jgi:hypothetical protein